MLKVDNAKVEVSGNKVRLAAELTALINSLAQDMEIFTREDVDFCVNTAFMPEEELCKETQEALTRLIKSLFSGL